MDLNAVRDTLARIFALYKKPGVGLTPAEAGIVLNAAAWAHRAEGWKLLGKKGGNNVPMPNGTLISSDFLVYGPTKRGWDCFIDGGGANSTVGGPEGDGEDMTDAIASGARSMEDPVDPGTGIPDVPPVDPPPTDPPVDLKPLIQQLNDLASKLRDQQTDILNMRDDVRALQDAPPPELTLPKLRVKGSTGRIFGHGHPVDLEVVRE